MLYVVMHNKAYNDRLIVSQQVKNPRWEVIDLMYISDIIRRNHVHIVVTKQESMPMVALSSNIVMIMPSG